MLISNVCTYIYTFAISCFVVACSVSGCAFCAHGVYVLYATAMGEICMLDWRDQSMLIRLADG